MGRKARLAEKIKKAEERADSYKGKIKKEYAEMSKKGLLGRMELDKYEFMRVEIVQDYKRRGLVCPSLPCESKGVTPTRVHYNLADRLYNQSP